MRDTLHHQVGGAKLAKAGERATVPHGAEAQAEAVAAKTGSCGSASQAATLEKDDHVGKPQPTILAATSMSRHSAGQGEIGSNYKTPQGS